jgi:hypothetical protein
VPLLFFFDGFSVTEPSPLLEVPDAVAAALNSVVFSQPFTAVRRYADIDAKLELLPLSVEVVPVEKVDVELEDRGSVRYLASCDIVVRKKVSVDANGVKQSEVDQLVNLLLSINEWLAIRELDADAGWFATTILTAVVHKHLREWHQYTGIIRVQYYVSRDLMPAPKNLT